MRNFSFDRLVGFLQFANLFLFFAVFIFIVFAVQSVEAKKFGGLKVHGDYRTLEPIVSEIPQTVPG
jgi:hypothetical protein